MSLASRKVPIGHTSRRIFTNPAPTSLEISPSQFNHFHVRIKLEVHVQNHPAPHMPHRPGTQLYLGQLALSNSDIPSRPTIAPTQITAAHANHLRHPRAIHAASNNPTILSSSRDTTPSARALSRPPAFANLPRAPPQPAFRCRRATGPGGLRPAGAAARAAAGAGGRRLRRRETRRGAAAFLPTTVRGLRAEGDSRSRWRSP